MIALMFSLLAPASDSTALGRSAPSMTGTNMFSVGPCERLHRTRPLGTVHGWDRISAMPLACNAACASMATASC